VIVASVASSAIALATEFASDFIACRQVASVARAKGVPWKKFDLFPGAKTRSKFCHCAHGILGDIGDMATCHEIAQVFCRQSDLTTGDTGDKYEAQP
jgi:hypothetical protein